jgi:hypothetical protein
MITATFTQALAGGGGVISIIGVLVVWRFIVSRFQVINIFECFRSKELADGSWDWGGLPS